jgi:putative flippase GtrA
MEKTKQFSKYGGVAAGSAATDYAVFSVLLVFEVGVLPAQMAARIGGGLFSFVLNQYWSFAGIRVNNSKREVGRFLVLYACSYALALSILYTLIEYAGLEPYPAKIITDIVCFFVNFLVMRSYVFGGTKGFRYALKLLFCGSSKTP